MFDEARNGILGMRPMLSILDDFRIPPHPNFFFPENSFHLTLNVKISSGTQYSLFINEVRIPHLFSHVHLVSGDFHCARRVLVNQMRYFADYLGDESSATEQSDYDISVQCDLRVFAWLMRYAQHATGMHDAQLACADPGASSGACGDSVCKRNSQNSQNAHNADSAAQMSASLGMPVALKEMQEVGTQLKAPGAGTEGGAKGDANGIVGATGNRETNGQDGATENGKRNGQEGATRKEERNGATGKGEINEEGGDGKWEGDGREGPDEGPPTLDTSNVLSILVSSHFLRMEPLVDEALDCMRSHCEQLLESGCSTGCINSALLTKLAARFTLNELDDLKDRKDKLKKYVIT